MRLGFRGCRVFNLAVLGGLRFRGVGSHYPHSV